MGFFYTPQYASIVPLHFRIFLPLRILELWGWDFWVLLWMSDSNGSVTVVFGTSISLIKQSSAPIFFLIKKSHHWCILLALKSRTGLYSLMRGKHLKCNTRLQLSFHQLHRSLVHFFSYSLLKNFGYSINILVKKNQKWKSQSRCFPFLQVDFSLSSPVFWTREYFLHEDLKQLGGQDIGQEKLQGTEPCTFFSKK